MPGRTYNDTVDPELSASLEELEAALALPVKERPDASSLVDNISDHGQRHGLSSAVTGRIIRIITQHPPLDISNSKQLLAHLYPSEEIPKQTVYTIVSALGPGARKPAPVVQGLLVRWLILVRPVLEDRGCLTHVYAVLFNLLGFLSIRSDICHILALSTERKHVLPFRVQKLLNFQMSTGQDAALSALLKIYRSFRPDLLPGVAFTGRAATFEYPDEEWKKRIDRLLEGHKAVATIEDETQFRVLHKTQARSKASYIPHVYTRGSDEKYETFEDVNGIEDFANKFNRLRLPVKMACALTDPLMQHYLEILPDTNAEGYFLAVNYEVGQALKAQLELLELNEPLDKGCIEILRASLTWTQRFKHLLGNVRDFCLEASKTAHWQAHSKLFIELLAWNNPYSTTNWAEGILHPEFEQNILAAKNGPTLLLSLYTQMIYNRLPAVGNIEMDEETFRSLISFADHVSPLALSILATSSDASAYLAVVTFLQALADIATHTHSDGRQWSILPLDTHVVHLVAFAAPNPSILTSLCAALADQKDAIFATAGHGRDLHWIPGTVPKFNGFIMDVSNLLWRCRAFATEGKSDANASGFMLYDKTKRALHEYVSSISHIKPAYNLHNFFTFSFHPALANIAAAAWKELETAALEATRMEIDEALEVTHRGPVTRNSLQLLATEGGAEIGWLEFRLHVLGYLADRGATGVQKLMQRTIKALMPKDGKDDEKAPPPRPPKTANSPKGWSRHSLLSEPESPSEGALLRRRKNVLEWGDDSEEFHIRPARASRHSAASPLFPSAEAQLPSLNGESPLVLPKADPGQNTRGRDNSVPEPESPPTAALSRRNEDRFEAIMRAVLGQRHHHPVSPSSPLAAVQAYDNGESPLVLPIPHEGHDARSPNPLGSEPEPLTMEPSLRSYEGLNHGDNEPVDSHLRAALPGSSFLPHGAQPSDDEYSPPELPELPRSRSSQKARSRERPSPGLQSPAMKALFKYNKGIQEGKDNHMKSDQRPEGLMTRSQRRSAGIPPPLLSSTPLLESNSSRKGYFKRKAMEMDPSSPLPASDADGRTPTAQTRADPRLASPTEGVVKRRSKRQVTRLSRKMTEVSLSGGDIEEEEEEEEL